MNLFKSSATSSERHTLTDVTAYAAEFDPAAIDIVRTAPVWMTRAERLLLFTLTFTLRPARYLEIGTLHGGSALIVCAAMDALGSDGKIVCLDPRPQVAPEDWQRLSHRAALITGLSPQALPAARDAAGGSFDLVLIDGDHTRAGVQRDANGVLSVIADGGHILFHDCFNPDVKAGIDAFARGQRSRVIDSGPLTREITADQLPDGSRVPWAGLRLMQVRS